MQSRRPLLCRSNRGVPPLSYETEQMLAAFHAPTKRARSNFQATQQASSKEEKGNDTSAAEKEEADDDNGDDDEQEQQDKKPRRAHSLKRSKSLSSVDQRPLHSAATASDSSSAASTSPSSSMESGLTVSSSSASASDSSTFPSTPSIQRDPALLIIRDRFSHGLLQAIRKEGHGLPPTGRRPYASYEEGMNEATAMRLMSEYGAYVTSTSKKLLRWLLFDVAAILQLLGCPATIDSVQYAGWIRCRPDEEPEIAAHAEFEALEVRFEKERNLMIFTSRTRLHSIGTNRTAAVVQNWPASTQHVFNSSQRR